MTRYTRSHGYHNVMRSHRYRPILIILLVLLAAFLIFKAAGVGGINEGNYEAQRNTRHAGPHPAVRAWRGGAQ